MSNNISPNQRAVLINSIIGVLNDRLRVVNKQLCAENRHVDQKPLHGGGMFFQLAYKSDSELNKIAKACGLQAKTGMDFRTWDRAYRPDPADRIKVKELPGFDANIFFRITGIDLRKQSGGSPPP